MTFNKSTARSDAPDAFQALAGLPVEAIIRSRAGSSQSLVCRVLTRDGDLG